MQFADLLSFLATGEPFSRRELAEVRDEISFSAAIDAHLEWKRRLAQSIADDASPLPDPGDLCNDTQCRLGQWIHGVGYKRYGYLLSFGALRAHHARFHQLACEIAQYARTNEADEAQRLLTGEFQHASREITSLLGGMSRLFGS